MNAAPAAIGRRAPMGFIGFVSLIAALMALNAVAIDLMLPGMPQIARALNLGSLSQAQWIVTGYLVGMGAAQLIYGALADRFGRRPIMLIGIAIYVLFSVVAGFATSLEMMVLARIGQGAGAAATRVLAVSVIRDHYSGRQMARVMSLSFIVLLAAPILAPSIGQAIIHVAPWPWLFLGLGVFGAAVFLWTWIRLPESLHPEDRLPLSADRIAGAFRLVLTNRISVGYMTAITLLMGALFGFVNSAQQIFTQVLGLGEMFPLAFGSIACVMALSSLINAKVVGRLGSRRVSHGALIGFVAFAGLHAALAASGKDTLFSFMALQGGMMFCFGLVGSNFGAMAMDPMGHIAGTASSVQGFVTTLGGAVIGFVIGQAFDGTAVPAMLGFFTMGLTALVVVFITERGKLFVPHAVEADNRSDDA